MALHPSDDKDDLIRTMLGASELATAIEIKYGA